MHSHVESAVHCRTLQALHFRECIFQTTANTEVQYSKKWENAKVHKYKVEKYTGPTCSHCIFRSALSRPLQIQKYKILKSTKIQRAKSTKIQKYTSPTCSHCIFGSVPAMRVGAGERDHPSLRPLLSALITQLIMTRRTKINMRMRRRKIMGMVRRKMRRRILCKECCMSRVSSGKKPSPYLFQIQFAYQVAKGSSKKLLFF